MKRQQLTRPKTPPKNSLSLRQNAVRHNNTVIYIKNCVLLCQQSGNKNKSITNSLSGQKR